MPRKLFSYNKFIGLDTVTSPSNMSERFLAELSGAYVDFRGQIVIGPALMPASTSITTNDCFNIKHFGPEDWVVYNVAGNTSILAKSLATPMTILFNVSTAAISELSIVNFDQKQFAFMSGHDPWFYDGTSFTNAATLGSNQYSTLGAYPKGGVAINILNRLVVAGIPGKPNELHISAQESYTDWRTNTSSGGTTPNITDGAIIDVSNQWTSNDTIQGLAVLEGDKLVVFGQNETLVYLADTNINIWEIARDFRVSIGIFGRNTAVNVGLDVFFCSRSGIHSLRRAISGLTLETRTFTREVQDTYFDLVNNVQNTNPPFTEPKAVWDGDLGQYRVFFPQEVSSSILNFRELKLTYDPSAGRNGHLSFSTNYGISCGSYYSRPEKLYSNTDNPSYIIDGSTDGKASSLMLGGPDFFGNGRVFNFPLTGSMSGSVNWVSPYWNIKTPLLSQGTPDTYKYYKRLIIRAVGTAYFEVEIRDSESNFLQNTLVRPEKDGFSTTLGIGGDSTRPIDIPIPHRSKSISIEFRRYSGAEGPLRILDFALIVDTK